MAKRVFLIVLDSLGIGETPDSHLFGDSGSNTLNSIRQSKYFNCPNLENLGLFNIDGVGLNATLRVIGIPLEIPPFMPPALLVLVFTMPFS